MRTVHKLLSVFLFFIGLTALYGGYGLLCKDGLGIPVESLHGVFRSFFVPGLILFLVVGGTHILASVLLWRGTQGQYEAVATAGFGLLIWEFTELYIMREPHWLQALYFCFGLATLVVTMVLLRYRPIK